MVTRWMWRLAAILAAILLAGVADEASARGREGPPARPGGPGGPGARPGGGPGPGGPMADEEMRAALEEVMRVRLKRALHLTPEQEERVMPRVERLQEARHDFATRRRRAVSHLRAVMIDETAGVASLEKALREVRTLEASFREREEALRAGINGELEPRQQARLYFFEERFRREMQRRLLDGPGRRGAGGPGGGPGRGAGAPPGGPPPDDFDPDDDGDDAP